MITIIDYGLGNVRSIYAKIEQMGEDVKISCSIPEIETADKIILPGVGAFDAGMENLRKLEIIPLLDKKVKQERTPILGICLGMQIFTQKSEEGRSTGLGYIDADTVRFKFDPSSSQNIPHMGWNTIYIQRNTALLEQIPDNSRFYFVHSFHVQCRDRNNVTALTNYGYSYPSVIQKDNIHGVQFHPEKSHKQGIQILKNFVRL